MYDFTETFIPQPPCRPLSAQLGGAGGAGGEGTELSLLHSQGYFSVTPTWLFEDKPRSVKKSVKKYTCSKSASSFASIGIQ